MWFRTLDSIVNNRLDCFWKFWKIMGEMLFIIKVRLLNYILFVYVVMIYRNIFFSFLILNFKFYLIFNMVDIKFILEFYIIYGMFKYLDIVNISFSF